MADTLEQKILKVVACETTPMWAFLCHSERAFTLCSQGFTELFEAELADETAASDEPPWKALPKSPERSFCSLPTRHELEVVLLSRQFSQLSKQFSPDYQLRFYGLFNESEESHGTLLFVESRLQVQLTPDQALRTHQASQQIQTLSPREAEVMNRVVSGMTNQRIAVDLGLSPKTIEKHRKKMMTKLRVQSVAEAARIAFDAELFELLLDAQHDGRPIAEPQPTT